MSEKIKEHGNVIKRGIWYPYYEIILNDALKDKVFYQNVQNEIFNNAIEQMGFDLNHSDMYDYNKGLRDLYDKRQRDLHFISLIPKKSV